jgi:hypothetical protein
MALRGSGVSGLGASATLRKARLRGGWSTRLGKDEVYLAWLADALQQLRQAGQMKIVGYLEAVSEELVFETKMTPRS